MKSISLYLFATILTAFLPATVVSRGDSDSSSSDEDEEVGSRTFPCYSSEFEATSIGTKVLQELFRDIYATDCIPALIGEVLRDYFLETFTVSINGELVVSGLEAVLNGIINANPPPEGAAVDLCLNHHTSFVALDVVLFDDDIDTFVWIGNLVSSPQAGGLPGRAITFVFDNDCTAKLAATNDFPALPQPLPE